MMNSYWAMLLDVTKDNDTITYGYTFRDRNMREAKLHAIEVCREMGCIPLPDVYRISHAEHVSMEKYVLPTMILFTKDKEEEA